MLTKNEMRVVYLLRKHGGSALGSRIAQQMSRVPIRERERALANCENLRLISSAKTPATRGRSGTKYWLTEDGKDYVQGLIDSGELTDPMLEPRAGKGGRRAAG